MAGHARHSSAETPKTAPQTPEEIRDSERRALTQKTNELLRLARARQEKSAEIYKNLHDTNTNAYIQDTAKTLLDEANTLQKTKRSDLMTARTDSVKEIVKMTQRGEKNFDIVEFTAAITHEMGEMHKSRELYAASNGEMQKEMDFLDHEQNYLLQLLTYCGIEEKDCVPMANTKQWNDRFAAAREQMDSNLGNALRMGVITVCGAWALFTAAIAIGANPDNPNLQATMVSLIPAVIAYLGKKGFTATEADRIKDEIAFMDLKPFRDFTKDHPGKLADPVTRMLLARDKANDYFKALQKNGADPDTVKEKTKARSELRHIMFPGAENSAEANALMDNELALADFARPILDYAKSPEAQRIVIGALKGDLKGKVTK